MCVAGLEDFLCVDIYEDITFFSEVYELYILYIFFNLNYKRIDIKGLEIDNPENCIVTVSFRGLWFEEKHDG